jgi:hypothetical protein
MTRRVIRARPRLRVRTSLPPPWDGAVSSIWFVSSRAIYSPLRQAIAVATLGAAILVPASLAGAQSAADQYVPQLDKGGVSEQAAPPGSSPSSTGQPAPSSLGSNPQQAAAETRDPGSSGGGEVPGTGFPITPFVAVLAVVVLIALAARFLVPALRR